MTAERYFDNAATTPLDPRVREEMMPFLDEAFGNAHSIHSLGLRAREAVEQARDRIARAVGAEDPSQIFFTSGATESNNWVLNAAEEVWLSPFEHSAMREPALRRGAQLLPHSGAELVDLPSLSPKGLVSVMAVNNEMGALWEIRELFGAPAALLHADATQAVGKVAFTVEGLVFASFSAHKFYGPKGVGALFCREQPPTALILGGEQEHGLRGGTLNVAAIVGFGKAAEIAADEQPGDHALAKGLRGIVLEQLHGLADWQINPSASFPTSPFILSLSFRGVEGEALVLELDRAGYAISAGAACSSRSTEPSHVLLALGLEPEWLRGTVRISFGRANTVAATWDFAKNLRRAVEMLRTL